MDSRSLSFRGQRNVHNLEPAKQLIYHCYLATEVFFNMDITSVQKHNFYTLQQKQGIM